MFKKEQVGGRNAASIARGLNRERRAAEAGLYRKGLLQITPKPQSPSFSFFRFFWKKTLKIQILDSLSQQKIAFQSINSCVYSGE